MPDRFGQGGDYSQTFAYLYDQDLATQERRAEEADQRREEDQAARDQQVFDRYNAGKITDEQLLAYIRRRIKETAYDKSQQANWQKALLEYTESINDARALREFEKSNDYGGYISYLRTKLSGMKGNSAAKAELEKQIQSLIDQRDQNSIAKGADRILLNIQRGKASYDDLLAFYKDRLNTVSDPALKQQIRQQITDISGRIRDTNLQNDVASLGRQLQNRRITPQEYGQRLQELANRSGYKETNPAQYNSWMQDATTAINTVQDFGRMEEIDGMLQRGEITPQKAMALYYAEAERYKSIDPSKYQQIRNLGWQVGHQPVEGQTPLPNPDVLGLPKGTMGSNGVNAVQTARDLAKQFKFMSQIDGTEFGQVNCVYTSAAMLAYAMGYREQGGGAITGGDMRYLSGDRSIGTNLDEAEAALAKLGITGLRNWNDRGMSFDKFKARVGSHGQAAVLMGVNNNLPDSLKAFAGAAKGHGVFIAAYDPKKDAFLWYDPAISKNSHPDYNGVWVDASVVKNFGWGPAYSDGTGSWSFNGQVLLTPPNTIKGRYNATDVKRPPIKYVNVDDVPVRPETPKSYRGYNNPGPSTRSRADNQVVDSKGKPRAAKNGRWYTDDGDVIDTVEEVKAELDKNQKRHEILNQLDDAYGKGKDRVNIGGQEYMLTPELFDALDKERLDLYDRDILFAQAAGLDDVINQRTKDRTTFLAAAASRNSLKADAIINTVVRDGLKVFDIANQDPDPTKAQQAARAINGSLKVIATVLKSQGQQTDTPLDDLSTDPKDPGSVINLDAIMQLFDSVANPATEPLADRIVDLTGLLAALDADDENHPMNRLAMGIAEQFEAQRKIDAGEAVTVIDGTTGKRGLVPLAPKLDPMTGTQVMVPVASDQNGSPIEMMQVPVQTPTGVQMQWVIPGRSEPIGMALVPSKNNETLKLLKGVPLSGLQLSGMDPAVIQQMVASGELQEQPITVPMVQMPPVKKDGRMQPGQTFFQDQSTGNWWSGVAPLASLGDRNLTLGRYLGMGKDLQPEMEWLPYATAGMTPLPYQGNRAAIQRAVDAGEVVLPTTIARGEDGRPADIPEANAAFYNKYDPLSSAYLPNAPTNTQVDDDPTDRGERIRQALDDIFRGAREAQDKQDWLVQQGIIDPVEQADLTGSGRPGVIPSNGYDPTISTPAPKGMPGYGPQLPVPPTGGFGPQGPGQQGNDPLRSVLDTAKGLGINVGPKGPQLPPTGLKGPQSYTPPAPKVAQQGKRQESSLPRIGGKQVVVGGTVINVPQSKPSTKAPPRNYTPPPPPVKMGAGGAAAASVAMLGKGKQTSKTGNGRYQS